MRTGLHEDVEREEHDHRGHDERDEADHADEDDADADVLRPRTGGEKLSHSAQGGNRTRKPYEFRQRPLEPPSLPSFSTWASRLILSDVAVILETSSG